MDDVQFLQELIQINSSNPPGNEHKVVEKLAARCEKNGIPYKITHLDENRSNLEITLKGLGDKQLFLSGHTDTVSPGKTKWEHPPFSGKIVGDRMYGRGTTDMKSGLAAMYLALESLFLEKQIPKATITFLATAGEEVDSCGASKFLADNPDVKMDALVIGEPTNEKIVIGHKGALWLEITTFGKTAHGSMPDQGINAVAHMVHVIKALEELKADWAIEQKPLGSGSLAVTMIEGGVQNNVIPDKCSIRVDIRTVPLQSHDELIAQINEKLTQLAENNEIYQFEVTKILDRPALLTSSSEEVIQRALAIKEVNESHCHGISYYTDGAVLNPRNEIPTLIYGPGDEKLAHQPNEWVSISSYQRSIQFFKQLILSYGGNEAE